MLCITLTYRISDKNDCAACESWSLVKFVNAKFVGKFSAGLGYLVVVTRTMLIMDGNRGKRDCQATSRMGRPQESKQETAAVATRRYMPVTRYWHWPIMALGLADGHGLAEKRSSNLRKWSWNWWEISGMVDELRDIILFLFKDIFLLQKLFPSLTDEAEYRRCVVD